MDLLYGRADTILEVEIERPSQPGRRHSVVVRRQPSPKKKGTKAASTGRKSPATELVFDDACITARAHAPTPIKAPSAAPQSAAPEKVSSLSSLGHIDMGSRLCGNGGAGAGGEASWDPEDGCSDSAGGRSTSSDISPLDSTAGRKHTGQCWLLELELYELEYCCLYGGLARRGRGGGGGEWGRERVRDRGTGRQTERQTELMSTQQESKSACE